MRFEGPDHVYKCAPKVLGNENSEEPVIIGLRGVSMVEFDKLKTEQQEIALTFDNVKAAQEITKSTLEFAKSKFDSIEGLYVGGKEIKTFDELYEKAPQEFVSWVMGAIYSTQVLTEHEVKN